LVAAASRGIQPAVDGNRVYGLTKFGVLVCLNTVDGSVVWQKKLPPTPYLYRWATSPIVDGNLVLINSGHAGLALDKASGGVVWDSGTSAKDSPVAGAANDRGKSTYASPVVLDLQGKRAALFFGPTALSAVETSTGKVLWSKPQWSVEVSCDPLVSGKLVLMPNGPMTLFDVGTGDPRAVWSSKEISCWISTPVLLDGYFYLVEFTSTMPSLAWYALRNLSCTLRCVELKTGKVAWTTHGPHVQFTAADGKLIMLDLDGTLSVVEATPDGFRPISSADVLAGADRPRLFPTPPVLYEGRVYCRNFAGDLVCVDMR
jgi:outer membrane protein assembly factor BamB